MARADIAGLFWDDTPPPKPPKAEKPKRVPPEPTWLSPDYLPGIEEARKWMPDLYHDMELIAAAQRGERLVWDIECYPNYFCIEFKAISCNKMLIFEQTPDRPFTHVDLAKLHWVLMNFILVDFNGRNYDLPIASLAVRGFDNEALMRATRMIIEQRERPYKVLKAFKVKELKVNHIDLIELIALKPSLKLIAGRLHAPRMQDLPFVPGTVLTPDQITILRWYCNNDLDNTKLNYKELLPEIQLRERMTLRYGVDMRSKSDAQLAEAVIGVELGKLTGIKHFKPPVIEPGHCFQYQVPHFLRYQTPLMNRVLEIVRGTWFEVNANGKVNLPQHIKDLKMIIADGVYRFGIGGLHSSEKRAVHHSDEENILVDHDVASFYPRIKLNLGLFPAHLGYPYLTVYNGIVTERLNAKNHMQGLDDKYGKPKEVAEVKDIYIDLVATADGLKIVVNGGFGKLGNKYSIFYSPNLLIQVTLTGQLSLLMLIERLELAGIPVISANTDGIIVKCPRHLEKLKDKVIKGWERDTGFETEATFYKSIYSRDVNNYFAIYDKPKKGQAAKVKGIFAEKGSSRNSILSKNPTIQICSDAALETLVNGTPVEATIRACRDIRKFVFVRTVKGGAVKVSEPNARHGLFLGKAIRWYYKAGERGEIVYASNGNKVPRSEGAEPIMTLPEEFPDDIDYDKYIKEANKILHSIGWLEAKPETSPDEDEDDALDEEAESEDQEELTA